MNQSYIYLLFTNTGSLLTKTIGLYTRAEYNHVSIAIDSEMIEVYSFGRRQINNPFWGGFVREKTSEAFFQNADCAIYKYAVTPAQSGQIRNLLSQFNRRQDSYRYNLVGLLGVLLNIPIQRTDAYFCSQFVSYLLIEASIATFDKPPELITPQDIQSLPGLIPMYQGKLAYA
jgi:hypothetical protein